MKGFEVLIQDIPDEGLEISATEGDPWLVEAMGDALGDAFDAKAKASLSLALHKVEGNVNIEGKIAFVSHPECDRCLTKYDEDLDVPLHTVLAPLYESERQREREMGLEAELVTEDLEFGYYEGDRIDIADVVRELIVLALPMKHLCRDDCKGLCQRCGKDLNKGLWGLAEQLAHGQPLEVPAPVTLAA